jgi:hypothetical protein
MHTYLLTVKGAGTYSYHSALKVNTKQYCLYHIFQRFLGPCVFGLFIVCCEYKKSVQYVLHN